MDLAQWIKREGPLDPPQAVGWALRLAKTLEEMHRRGIVHGAICLQAVQTADRDCSAPAELLGSSRIDQDPQYHSAERAVNGRQSGADDVWAVGVALYYGVTKAMPFSGETDVDVLSRIEWRPASPIEAYGCEAEDVQEVLDRIFAPERSRRITSAAGLRAALRRCVGGDDALPLIPLAPTKRPQSPSVIEARPARKTTQRAARRKASREERPSSSKTGSQASATVATPSDEPPVRPRRKKGKVTTTQWLLAALVVVAIAVYAIRRNRQPTRATAALASSRSTATPHAPAPAAGHTSAARGTSASTATPRPARAASSIATTSTGPATSAAGTTATAGPAPTAESPARRDACILQIFPKGTFAGPPPSFETVCIMTDPHQAALLMRSEAVKASRGQRVTKAMEEWAQIGWYDMAAIAVLQGLCCPQPAELSTPRVFAACQLDAALAELSAAGRSRGRKAMQQAIDRFTQAATCTAEGGGNALYGYGKLPSSAETIILDEMLRRLTAIR